MTGSIRQSTAEAVGVDRVVTITDRVAGVGDPDSFDEAFTDLYPRALGLAFRILGNRAAAEDIAAETMARAYVRWHRLDPQRRPGWVLRVASNQAIDLLRRKGHTLQPGVIDIEDGTVLRMSLAAAVARLPRRQREAITLRFFSDLSEADTARALGIGVGSVKTHTHRGLEALRAEFGERIVSGDGGHGRRSDDA